MTPALEQIKALPAEAIERGWQETFSTQNPYCPCDLKSFTKAVRWAEHALQSLSDEAGEAVQQLAECFRLAGGDTECVSTPEGQARQAAEVVRDLRACYDEAIRPAPAAEAAPQGGGWPAA